MSPFKTRLLKVMPLMLMATLAWHFGMTMLYLTPLNPVKARLMPFLRSYIEPYFWQKWDLFAPNPTMDNRFALISRRISDGRGGTEDTPWYDVTTPVWELKYKYRFTPADRLERAFKAPSYLALGTPDLVLEKMKQHPDAFKDLLSTMGQYEMERKKRGMRLFARLASAHCDQFYGAGLTSEVRVQYLIVKPPPFSKRAEPDDAGEATVIEFPWQPYEQVAAL